MSSDDEDMCAAIVLAAALVKKCKPKIEQRKWVNDWLLEREAKGSFGVLFQELSLQS